MRRSKYTAEFKAQAVKLVLEQKISIKEASQDLGMGESTLNKWLGDYRKQNVMPDSVTESERDELKRLRKENIRLKIERDLLKKTAVYFAKTSQNDASSS